MVTVASVAVPARPVSSSCKAFIESRPSIVEASKKELESLQARIAEQQAEAEKLEASASAATAELNKLMHMQAQETLKKDAASSAQSCGRSVESWVGVPRTILTSSGLHRAVSCIPLQREFERLCPGGDPRNARVIYDITAFVNNGIGSSVGSSVYRGPSDLEDTRKSAERNAKLFADDYGIQHMDVFDLSAPDFNWGLYADAVKGADVYYAETGNTWALLFWLKARGGMTLADGVMERTKRGEMLYVGNSAGGICGGKSVETATWKNWDDMWEWQKLLPENLRTNWNDPFSRTAMDLAGGLSFFPHYDSTWAKVCEERRMELDHDVVCCANGSGLVVINGSGRLVSPDSDASHVPLKL